MMDARKTQFLVAVVGDDGASALIKAAERAEELDQAIFARTVLAWLDVNSSFGYEGNVPGVESARLTFKKSGTGFSGSITLNEELHRFENASIAHVAGAVAVALGLDHERVSPMAKSEQLAKLGKSIDLLVKSKIVKAAIKPNSQQKRINLPGMAAQPIGPIGPTPPTPTQPKNQTQPVAGAAGTAQAIKLPGISKPKKPSLLVSKSESKRKCRHCAKPQFTGDKFTGCYCFSSLAKSVKVAVTESGYNITFGVALDNDAIVTLTEVFRGK